MGPTLYWHLVFRAIKLFLTLSLGVFGLVLMVDTVELLRQGMGDKLGGLGLLWLGAKRAFVIIQIIFPFIMLLTAIFSLIGLNRSRELVVMRAAGLSVWRFLTPLATVALLTGALAAFVVSPLAAVAQRSADSDVATSLANAPIASTKGPMTWLRQTDGKSVLLIGSRGQAAGYRFLADVMIFVLDENSKITRRVQAQEARFFSGAWQLKNAIVSKSGTSSEEVASLTIRSNVNPTHLGAKAADPSLLSLFELPEAKQLAKKSGLAVAPYDLAWHSLLARPFVFLIMVTVASIVCLRFGRFGRYDSMVLGGMGAGFLFYVYVEIFDGIGAAGSLPPFAAVWIPLSVALMGAVTVLLHQEDG